MEAGVRFWIIFVFNCLGVLGVHSLTSSPQIFSIDSYLKVQEGDTIELPCKVDQVERLVRVWKQLPSRVLFSGSVSVSKDEKISLGYDGSLQLQKVTPEYSGEYSCQVHMHPKLRVVHKIEVLVPPMIIAGPPNGKVIVRRDNPATVFCNVSGSPFPSVTWTYQIGDEMKTSLPGGVRLEEKGTQLLISSADLLHTGLYHCTADNDVGGPVTATFNITVLYVPEVAVQPEWIHGDDGANMEFTCTSKSIPISHIRWMKGGSKQGRALQSDGHIQITESVIAPTMVESTIKIPRLSRDDLGSYTCLSKNTVGQSWKTVELSGLAEPVNLRGTETSDTSYSLLWSTKSYSPIIEYQLKIREHKSIPDWTDVAIPAAEEDKSGILYSQSYEVTGLEPGILYEALVFAHNDFGWNRAPETLFFHTGTLVTDADDVNTEVSMLPLLETESVITEPTFLKQDSSVESSSSPIKSLSALIIALLIILS